MNFQNPRNGMKIIGRKKKNVPSWKRMKEITRAATITITVSGQPDHFMR